MMHLLGIARDTDIDVTEHTGRCLLTKNLAPNVASVEEEKHSNIPLCLPSVALRSD